MDRRYLEKINTIADQKTLALMRGEIDQLDVHAWVDEALKDTELTEEEIKKIAEEYIDILAAKIIADQNLDVIEAQILNTVTRDAIGDGIGLGFP